MGVLYAVPWYDCDLRCPHCEVGNSIDSTDEQFELWLHNLKQLEGHYPIILFGGEPTMYEDKFIRTLRTGKISSVSTNLVHTSCRSLDWIADSKCDVATSWNPHRFNEHTLRAWHFNLAMARDRGIDITVLITLTKDLFHMNMNELIEELKVISSKGVDKFLFEHYIGEEDLNTEADEWLVKFHDVYEHSDIPMANLIEEKLNNWICDCTKTMTLEPTGRLRKGCPQSNGINIPSECLTCGKSHLCQPCVLQKTCSYPKKLAHHLSTLNN